MFIWFLIVQLFPFSLLNPIYIRQGTVACILMLSFLLFQPTYCLKKKKSIWSPITVLLLQSCAERVIIHFKISFAWVGMSAISNVCLDLIYCAVSLILICCASNCSPKSFASVWVELFFFLCFQFGFVSFMFLIFFAYKVHCYFMFSFVCLL